MPPLLFSRLPTFTLASISLLTCVPPSVRAELTWTQKTVEIKADAATAVCEARFSFKNTGTQPVDVNQVMSSCGCTTVNLEKRHYLPGETGEILAKYTVAEHGGTQKKTVLVTTNDGGDPVELTLSVKIPEVLRITPSFVTWKHKEAPAAKQITIELAQETPIKEITIQSSNAAVIAELQPLTKGRKYQLTVKPGQTGQHLFATLTIHCRFGDNARDFRTYATVQPALKEE